MVNTPTSLVTSGGSPKNYQRCSKYKKGHEANATFLESEPNSGSVRSLVCVPVRHNVFATVWLVRMGTSLRRSKG
jgi:hypothetical protein